MELTGERFVDLAAGEVEAGEIAIVRKAGGLELIGGRSHLAVGLSLQPGRDLGPRPVGEAPSCGEDG